MTEAEIRRVCEEWVRGEHFPVEDADEQRLRALLAEDSEQWLKALREMMEDLSDPAEGSNLAYVLAPGDPWAQLGARGGSRNAAWPAGSVGGR